MRLLELLKHFGQREPVGNHQRLVQQAFVRQRDGLVDEDTRKQVFGVDITNHVIQVAVAHRVGGKRLGRDAGPHHHVRGVAQKPGDPVARRHGTCDGQRVQLKHIGNDLLLAPGQQTGLGADFSQGQDVVRRDAVITLRGQAQRAKQGVGRLAVNPYKGLEDRHARLHGPRHHDRQLFRRGHAQALGHQVGKQDEQRCHHQK